MQRLKGPAGLTGGLPFVTLPYKLSYYALDRTSCLPGLSQ